MMDTSKAIVQHTASATLESDFNCWSFT